MNLSAPFIARPVATSLVTIGIALVGIMSYFLLPVAPLPQVDFPTVLVMASMPGASPETMATSVATPLERHLGQIADVTEMTSSSTVGNARVTLQFGLDRDIDGAARDVQAAINAARADLPTSLKNNPTYRKMNPADAPIMIMALTSPTLSKGQIYDSASTVIQQKLSQIKGVGQVTVGGGSSPAVRVEINPKSLAAYHIGLEDVRAALSAANQNVPKGAIERNGTHYQIVVNDQSMTADEYKNLVIASRNNAVVRLRDVADVIDSVEDVHNMGLLNNLPSVPIIISRQPGANIIETVDRIKAVMPEMQASIPASVNLIVGVDRTNSIRASLSDVQKSLLISIILVVFIVFLFLRDTRAILIPAVAVPVSLIGTFAAMYLCGYSLDNLSMMALIVCTGFVVDDAIIVLENVTRHIEAGVPRFKAALLGAREVCFTVISMSLSLIAVFLPIMLMGGIVGRLFREFAVTLSIAVFVSMLLSLSTTPMMCAYLLRSDKKPKDAPTSGFLQKCENIFLFFARHYESSLTWALAHSRIMMVGLVITVGLNIYLYIQIPKGFFPQQDVGQMMGNIVADQSVSFQLMSKKLTDFVAIVKADPSVENVTAFTGGSQVNTAQMFVSLKPLAERKIGIEEVIARLRKATAKVPGATLFLQPVQDIRMGGRAGNAMYQYTLQSDKLQDLRNWTPKLVEALRPSKTLVDVNADQQDGGVETVLVIDRDAASRLGLKMSQIDNNLYDAFGQRQVSTIYKDRNQYHVVMELASNFAQNPEDLGHLYLSPSGGTITNPSKGTSSAGSSVSTSTETMIPLSAISRYETSATPLAVNHQGHFAASTISFNLPIGQSLSEAVKEIDKTMHSIGAPASLHGSFQGTAKMFQETMANQPILILAALLAVYMVLGVLYESTIHPITILSTLPSAGLGALVALMACKMDLTIMAIIGIILLIGIVKKNAIMMVDFAIEKERRDNVSPQEAIREACLLRFRPIMMTTMAAIMGALPLAFGTGEGASLRQPLGVSIVGGLIVSQALTLYTTPIVYLYMDRLTLRHRQRKAAALA